MSHSAPPPPSLPPFVAIACADANDDADAYDAADADGAVDADAGFDADIVTPQQ